ncbi:MULTISPECIES: DUF6151 family protein [unclassified Ruegeria]|uniref:DUF6151 family protein n=1 Tax=unclassified Ruegeria TaxID=2625375 RepID=UPI0014899743|nr:MULTISPECIES: DUF6151 family protein [unclassified Ruegeria]NOD35898.1 hypothetical protein [Ruegeria sp. HKCCD7296]NOE43290.1 hypothetical protein [Ruegeria sp. HKCCD7319]
MSEPAHSGLAFSCRCGSLQGRISARGVRQGTHVECFCHDCRAAQLYFKQPDPAPGAVDILQMAPDEIEISAGGQFLAVMKLSPNGMLRWYANCCNTPLATTPPGASLPFAGFLVRRITDDISDLGPVTTRGFVPRPNGKQKHEKISFAAFGLIRRVAISRLSGRWKNTPFFDRKTGEPVAAPVVISKDERAALYP